MEWRKEIVNFIRSKVGGVARAGTVNPTVECIPARKIMIILNTLFFLIQDRENDRDSDILWCHVGAGARLSCNCC